MKKKRKKLNGPGLLDVFLGIILTLLGISIFIPFYHTVIEAITPQSEYLTKRFVIFPEKVDWTGFKYIFQESLVGSGYVVSSIVTVLGTAYDMFFNVTVAYVLTRKFPGRKLFYVFLIFPGILPGGMIPGYILVSKLGLIDSLGALILPGGLAWGTALVMARFIHAIPYDLEEAAVIDGANEMTILWKVILPLSLPIIATYSLFTAVTRWNDWFGAVLYMRTASKMPLQTVLRNLINSAQSFSITLEDRINMTVYPQSVKMAALVVTVVPIMCLYPFAQKYFVTGLTAGAVKS